MSYSRNIGTARAFIAWLLEKEQYTPWLRAGAGYDAGALKAYEDNPAWKEDPKLLPLLEAARSGRWLGWPGPPTRAAAESDARYVVVDLFARVLQGTAPRDSMAQAEQALREVYK